MRELVVPHNSGSQNYVFFKVTVQKSATLSATMLCLVLMTSQKFLYIPF
jgi:hypothetical protein